MQAMIEKERGLGIAGQSLAIALALLSAGCAHRTRIQIETRPLAGTAKLDPSRPLVLADPLGNHAFLDRQGLGAALILSPAVVSDGTADRAKVVQASGPIVRFSPTEMEKLIGPATDVRLSPAAPRQAHRQALTRASRVQAFPSAVRQRCRSRSRRRTG